MSLVKFNFKNSERCYNSGKTRPGAQEMAYSSKCIANEFIALAKKSNQNLDVLKLIKLVSIADGWNLAINDAPLIFENIEAWKYGPVIPSLYHAIKRLGKKTINNLLVDVKSSDKVIHRVHQDDAQTVELIKKIWNVYGGLSGIQLSNLTHEKDTPWDKVYEEKADNKIIPREIIKDHYLTLVSRK